MLLEENAEEEKKEVAEVDKDDSTNLIEGLDERIYRVEEADAEDESSEEIYDLSIEEVSAEVLRQNRRTILTRHDTFFSAY